MIDKMVQENSRHPLRGDALYRRGALLLLLVGVFLRWTSFAEMGEMLHYDEAFHGVDALSIIQNPRLTPFLPGNFGREAGWVYYVLPFVLVWGATTFALRLAATTMGILTLAAAHRLGRELFGERGAFWALGALSVFYWHTHMSHRALRANLFIFVGTLAASALLAAWRTNRRRAWIAAGIASGALAYTYFASVGWLAYLGATLLLLALVGRRRAVGARFALVTMALIVLPMALYIPLHSEHFLNRPQTVAVMDQAGLRHNLGRWARAWFQEGDANPEFNLPGRPILSPLQGLFGGVGLVSVAFVSRRRWYAAWFAGWALCAWLPSLMSNWAPHFLRASGLTVPVAIVLGMGAWTLARGLTRLFNHPVVNVLPLLLLGWMGVETYRDFHLRWLNHPQVFMSMEKHINEALSLLREETGEETAVYFTPFSPSHPVIGYRRGDLAPRPVGAFDSHQCLVIPEGPAAYVSLTMYEPDFESRLSRWAETELLYRDPEARYSVYAARPTLAGQHLPEQRVAVFGESVEVRPLAPISQTVHAGETVPVVLGVGLLHPVGQAYSLFLHLYGTPPPEEGGKLWAQGDSQLCASYPTPLWRPGETVVQRFDLQLPDHLPPGTYTVATGIYAFPNGARLPLSAPPSQPEDYWRMASLEVVP